jgi:hypothetical protein
MVFVRAEHNLNTASMGMVLGFCLKSTYKDVDQRIFKSSGKVGLCFQFQFLLLSIDKS